MPAKMLLVENWGKMAYLPQPTTCTSFLLEISYISLFSIMTTLHYHRLYQISSILEANSSLEDMNQVGECRQKPSSHSNIPTYGTPKLNNQA